MADRQFLQDFISKLAGEPKQSPVMPVEPEKQDMTPEDYFATSYGGNPVETANRGYSEPSGESFWDYFNPAKRSTEKYGTQFAKGPDLPGAAASGLKRGVPEFLFQSDKALTGTIPRSITALLSKLPYAGVSEEDKKRLFEKVNKPLEENIARVERLKQEYYAKNPDLTPKEGYEQPLAKGLKDPKLKENLPEYVAYRITSGIVPSLVAIGTGTAVTMATGNPAIGATAAGAVFFPIEHAGVYDSVIEAGGTADQAAIISAVVAPMIAAVESMGDYVAIDTLTKGALSKVVKDEITKNAGKITLKRLLAQGVKDFSKIVVSETAEEVVQEILGNAAVKVVDKNRGYFENVPETALETLFTAPVIGLAGGGVNMMSQARGGVDTSGVTDYLKEGERGTYDPDRYGARERLRARFENIKAPAGYPEAGIQKDIFGGETTITPKTAGKITQANMDDYAKLEEYKAKLTPAKQREFDAGVEQATNEIEENAGAPIASQRFHAEDTIQKIEEEQGNRATPFHGGRKNVYFKGFTNEKLDGMNQVFTEFLKNTEGVAEPAQPVTSPETTPQSEVASWQKYLADKQAEGKLSIEERASVERRIKELQGKPITPSSAPLTTGKEPWQMTKAEHAKGTTDLTDREDFARAWTPIKAPRGTANKIEFVPYTGGKGVDGVLRWNDSEGIGRGILTIDGGKIGEVAVEKSWRRKGIATQLYKEAAKRGVSESKGTTTLAAMGVKHKLSVQQALSEGKPVPPEVLKDYPELAKAEPAPPALIKAEEVTPTAQPVIQQPVVFHGGVSGLTEIKTPAYFTTRPEYAESHAGIGGQVYPVELHTTTPLIIGHEALTQSDLTKAGIEYQLTEEVGIDQIGYNNELIKAIQKAGYDSVQTPDDASRYIPQILVLDQKSFSLTNYPKSVSSKAQPETPVVPGVQGELKPSSKAAFETPVVPPVPPEPPVAEGVTPVIPPVEPPKPPIAEGDLQPEAPREDPVKKLTRLINEKVKPALKTTQALRKQERKPRVGAYASTFQKAQTIEEAQRARGFLAGKYSEGQFEPLTAEFTPADMSDFLRKIQDSSLRPLEKGNALDALVNLIQKGQIPREFEISLLEDVYGEELVKSLLNLRTTSQKVWSEVVSALNLPRAIATAFDLSATLRQAGILTVNHPIKASKSFVDQVRAFGSEEYAQAVDASIRDKLAEYGDKANDLFISKIGGATPSLTQREEAFISRWSDKIPGVRQSARAYITYLNKMRADVFSQYADAMIQTGITDQKEFDAVARGINIMSGRGDMGRYGSAGPVLSGIFYAPRYVMSRLQAPTLLFSNSKTVRKMAARHLTVYLGMGMTALALAKLAGGDVEDDPRSSDFGKIKFGNTRWDIWAGFQQYVRFLTQIITGERKTAGGEIEKTSRLGTAGRFIQGKLAPFPGLVADTLAGRTFVGDEMTLTPSSISKQAYSRLAPYAIQDIIEAFNEGTPENGLGATTALLGVSVQTYGPEWKKISEAQWKLGAIDAEAKKKTIEDATSLNDVVRAEEKDWTYTTSQLAQDISKEIEDRKYSQLAKDPTTPPIVLFYRESYDKINDYYDTLEKDREAYLQRNPEVKLMLLFWGKQKEATTIQKIKLKELAKQFGIPESAIPALGGTRTITPAGSVPAVTPTGGYAEARERLLKLGR